MGTKVGSRRARRTAVIAGALLVAALGLAGVRATVQDDAGDSGQQTIDLDDATPIRISPDGRLLAVERDRRLCDGRGFALIRLSVATGTMELVREAPAAGAAAGPDDSPNPLMGALSPDGSRLLCVTVGGRLILRDADGSETVLAEDLDVVPGSTLHELGPALAWLADGTVYVPLTGGQALLLDIVTR